MKGKYIYRIYRGKDMRTVLILVDSLSRRFLNCYNSKEEAYTPNIDRLAKKSTIFNNHYCGSAPCIPARRDLMTGRYNFLERPWGAIEAFDNTIQSILSKKNVFTSMITDHYHYFEVGAENYIHSFSNWSLIRGQENDLYYHRPGENGIINENRVDRFSIPVPYKHSRKNYNQSADYPTPKTLTEAADWIRENKNADNYFLWVECFDPHEPFDVPKKYLEIYEDEYKGKELIWPLYTGTSEYTNEEIKHIRNRYKALITMTDEYIGKILDVLDENNMWGDTQVILTTDHGYMLGEHEYFAKNYMPDYNEIFHIPLIIHYEGQEEKKYYHRLTQNIDLFPTILDYFGIELDKLRNPIHGISLKDIYSNPDFKSRESIIFGQFGKTVNMTDGKYTFFKVAENEDNQPLNIYTSMPTILTQYLGYETIDKENFSKIGFSKLKWNNYPVYKIPANIVRWKNESQTFESKNKHIPEDMIFDNARDYKQENSIKDLSLRKEYSKKLKELLIKYDAPDEQFIRLGL